LKVRAGSQQCGDEIVGLGAGTRPRAAGRQRQLFGNPMTLKSAKQATGQFVTDEDGARAPI
jgi:hypothetical protein